MNKIQNALFTMLACLLPPFPGIAQLALLWANVPPERRIFSHMPQMLWLPTGARIGAVCMAAFLITILATTPYAHAPRDMPMIVGHDAGACTAPLLQALYSQLACYRQGDDSDPFDRVLAAKGIGDMTAMTEFLVSTYSVAYLRQLVDAYAWDR